MIEVLPDHIANQIAAGEVIQRPASMVKELLENAIDAGATQIHLIIKDAGKSLVQVVDNGCGMNATDARLCFERHATSKLKQSEDLFNISTKGFRGEALASVAAVARVELKTKRAEEDVGTSIVMEGSQMQHQEEIATSDGTSISVNNLFYNVPARRKFLKSNAVELRHIYDEFHRVALAHPNLAFELTIDDKEIYKLQEQNLKQRIIQLLGKNYESQLIEVHESTDILKLHGFVAKPEMAKKKRGDQFFFINQRYFKSAYFNHAVNSAFQDLIPADHRPAYVLFLEMDPKSIDVNVHPTKQEVKFEDQSIVYNYLKVAIRHALGKSQVVPALDFDVSNHQAFQQNAPRDREKHGFNNSFSKHRPEGSIEDWNFFFDTQQSDQTAPNTFQSKANQEEQGLFAENTSTNPYQVLNSYIIHPISKGMMIIDQELAHERVLYEAYLKSFDTQSLQIQQQLYPTTIDLTAQDAQILKEILSPLRKMGFDVQEFGHNTFIVQGLPNSEHDFPDIHELVDDLLMAYKEDRKSDLSAHEVLAKSLAKSSCIRKGKSLTNEEMEHLIGKLLSTSEPNYTPSGRKTFFVLSVEDLQKKFGRLS